MKQENTEEFCEECGQKLIRTDTTGYIIQKYGGLYHPACIPSGKRCSKHKKLMEKVRELTPQELKAIKLLTGDTNQTHIYRCDMCCKEEAEE